MTKIVHVLMIALIGLSLGACAAQPDASNPQGTENTVQRPQGWTEASHGQTEPNYAVVFPQDNVNTLTITISPENWTAMQDNMTELFGEAGNGPNLLPGAPPAGAVAIPADGIPPAGAMEIPADGIPPAVEDVIIFGGEAGEPPEGPQFQANGPNGRVMMGGMSSENPMWVEATIAFNGQTWNNVGVRYKGNSSLHSAWSSDSGKLPFKIDFDQFEKEHPEIDNQRFYGFKQLSLASGFGDSTFMRDTVTYDLLEQAGLPAAETAYYEVILDYGEGQENLGIYTAIEVIDDTVIEREFADASGNIYEGDGPAATLAEGTADQIKDSFQKENNQQADDWSDIGGLYAILHDETRTSDPAAWKAKLEARFDVDGFLEWLAISAVIKHWDTYGAMSHNFYLYNDPTSGKLTWISWDHNLVLGGSGDGGAVMMRTIENGADEIGAAPAQPIKRPRIIRGPGGMMGGNQSLDRKDVNDQWPLIRYLLDDPDYYQRYVEFMRAFVANQFKPEALTERYQELATLLAPYVDDQAAFNTAVEDLIKQTQTQADAAKTFLDQQ